MINYLIDIVLGLTVFISLITDLKEQKIYNKVVFPAILAGFAINIYNSGWNGFLFSGKGLLVGAGLLFIPFLLGGMSAGDVKLLGAIGAIKGMVFVFYAFIGTALAGGIVALMIMITRKKFLAFLNRIGAGLYIIFTTKNINSIKNTDLNETNFFPYGLAITLGTVAAYVMR